MKTEKPLRELSIEEILRLTFELYSKKFSSFLIPMLVASLVSGSFSALIGRCVENMPQLGYETNPEAVWSYFWNYMVPLLAIAFIIGIISWLISTIAEGTCVKFAAENIEKGEGSLGEAFNFIIYKLPSLIAAAIITVILIVLGFIAFIIPGIILAIMFSLVIPTIIIENVGTLDSLSRSRRLVSNRWLKTLALLLIVYLLTLFVSYIGTLIGQPFGEFKWLISGIISAFVQPIIPIALTFYYYSMLAKEQQRMIPPPPPPPF